MSRESIDSDGEKILSASSVRKDYKAPSGNLKVLKGIDLNVSRGEMIMILGRSGSGKSTFLHLLGGLDRPTSGTIDFLGKNIVRYSERRMAEYRSKHVGFVFQFYHLLPELTLFENVLLPSRIAGKTKREEAERLIQRVGLAERKNHYPAQLSGGEQQRTAVARALVNSPDLILCDEPTGNLDEETAQSVFELLLALNEEEKKTFIIVTHETSLVKRGKTVYELKDGILEKEKSEGKD